MNEKTKGHDACDSHHRGLNASSPHHSYLLQPHCTDKPIDEVGDYSFENQSNDHPSPAVFEELFCPALPTAALAPLAFTAHTTPHSDVVKQGYLGKQEQKHRRYFVLKAGSHSGPSRLEWYKTQDKFTAVENSAGDTGLFGSHKQGVIYLRCCLGISRISSSRKEYKVALYAKDQTLVFVGKDQQEQHEWYVAIKKLMEEELMDECYTEGYEEEDAGYCTLPPAAFFKQVWPVTVKPRGLGRSKALTGEILLCLTASSLVLVRVGQCNDLPSITLPLLAVRRFGHLEGSFFLELGRSAPHGPGEIWMEARNEGDLALAQQIHEVVRGVVRTLRVLPDWSSTSTNPQSQGLLAFKRSRPKHREKHSRPHSSPPPQAPCEGLTSDHQEPEKPLPDSYMEMKTEDQSPVQACKMEEWESSEEEAPGYMLMSPQVSRDNMGKHQDEYVAMASPQKQDWSTSSLSFSSDGHSPLHASPHHITMQTPPPWTLSSVQRAWTTSSPLRTSEALRPVSLFRASPSRHSSADAEAEPVRSVRTYLLSCLPSCLQGDRT